MAEAPRRPHLALTPGDPLGIGPEIAARACTPALLSRCEVTLLGDRAAISEAFERWGDVQLLAEVQDLGIPTPGRARLYDEHALLGKEVAPEVSALRVAVEGCLAGAFDALVTGPISKERLAQRGFPYPGHTGYLAHLTGVRDPVMAFVSPRLRVALVTDHVPLSRVSASLSRERLLATIRVAHEALREAYGIPSPRLALCGLNPHAGEGGLLGDEEQALLIPCLSEARAEGIDIRGPVPADSVFSQAIAGRYDLVVALYHDQGLIPIKLLGRGASVHITMGLPIVRTSVDHGTADDIAGQGIADPAGLAAALEEALLLTSGR